MVQWFFVAKIFSDIEVLKQRNETQMVLFHFSYKTQCTLKLKTSCLLGRSLEQGLSDVSKPFLSFEQLLH